MLYGCDFGWWRLNKGLRDFAGLKLSQDGGTCVDYPEIHRVTVEINVNSLLTDKPGHIGSGQNGGFQALNIVVQFGARRIILVGFDMKLGAAGEVHWHGRHKGGLSNPAPSTLARWRATLDGQAGRLKQLGVEVVVCGDSALTAYPKMSLEDALRKFAGEF